MVRTITGAHIHLSSHTHNEYLITEKDASGKLVYISQLPAYGAAVGKMEYAFNPETKELHVKNANEHVLLINEQVPFDEQFMNLIDHYKSEINTKVLPERGSSYAYNTPMATIDQSYAFDLPMGRYIVSGLYSELNNYLNKSKEVPLIDLYFSGLLMIRSGLEHLAQAEKTRFQFSDVYKLLGITTNKKIVCFYLTAAETLTLIDAQAIYNQFVDHEYVPLYSYSLRYETNWYGIPFYNRVVNPTLNGKPYQEWPKLVHMCTVDTIVKYFYVPVMKWLPIRLFPRNEQGDQIMTAEELLAKRGLQGAVEFELLAAYWERVQHVASIHDE